MRNILHCLGHGTQLGWLINPDEELVFAYFPNQTIAMFKTASDRLIPGADLDIGLGQGFNARDRCPDDDRRCA